MSTCATYTMRSTPKPQQDRVEYRGPLAEIVCAALTRVSPLMCFPEIRGGTLLRSPQQGHH